MTTNATGRRHCDVRRQTVPALAPDLAPNRAGLIRMMRSKWVKETVLHYHFTEGPDEQRQAVRNAFKEWKELGLALEFTEVTDNSEAEIRITFDQRDGSWSYVGRDILNINAGEPTMNFGWDLTDSYGHTTALHEIGHTIGMPHEHQNPFAGIVWDEAKVYEYFTGPPNQWPRDKIYYNVLRKLDPAEVEGSQWDPDSVMEYCFPAGLIREPAKYSAGLDPAGGLSQMDKEWVTRWYAPSVATVPALQPFQSAPLSLTPGQQVDFAIEPAASRKYQVGTFGTADTILVLFEEVDGKLRYLRGDDDSGVDRNARIAVKLFKERRYVVRLRLYWAGESGQCAIMYW